MKRAYLIFLILIACTESNDPIETIEPQTSAYCASSIIDQGKYYTINEREYLWADEDTTEHFDITDWTLDPCNLYYGLGKEHFKALISPKFDQLSNVIDQFQDHEKAVVVEFGNSVKIYPYSVIVQHEMVNDVIDGVPVMIVYCFLADLAATYKRSYCGRTLTFGVSGYTYSDSEISDGLESFVLWDRDTESLWWPIIDKGVSGQFKNQNLIKYNTSKWEILTWDIIKSQYNNGLVLKRGQTMLPPEKWSKIIDAC